MLRKYTCVGVGGKMSEITEIKKQLAEIQARLDAFEQGVSADFDKVVVDGVDYYDSKKDVTHQGALDLAEKHGLRVMESWELNKLYIESDEFRKSLSHKWYWCASVVSNYRNFAWQFNGYYGYAYTYNRNLNNGVRCVRWARQCLASAEDTPEGRDERFEFCAENTPEWVWSE
jgi:hypothetical protein